jgi:anaerobic glycerol-3-phosphate dehydrogenase
VLAVRDSFATLREITYPVSVPSFCVLWHGATNGTSVVLPPALRTAKNRRALLCSLAAAGRQCERFVSTCILATTQAVCRRSLTTKVRVRLQASPCGISAAQSDTGTGFSPRNSVVRYQYHSITDPFSFI